MAKRHRWVTTVRFGQAYLECAHCGLEWRIDGFKHSDGAVTEKRGPCIPPKTEDKANG